MTLFDRTTIPTLGRALEAYALRHKAIASNIANAGTAGYSPKRVSFEEQLSSSEGTPSLLSGTTTDQRHIPIGLQPASEARALIEETPASGGDPLASGVNAVDVDQEMAELAKNQIRYKFSARLIGEAFRGLQKSIKGSL
jgi:flagellar basal-body rod protein FlgB